jgi:hypothetical protein
MEYQPQDSLETRKQQYMTLLDGYPEAYGVPYETLKEDCRIEPQTGRRMNDYVLEKAKELNLSGDVLTGVLAASPLFQQMLDEKMPVSDLLQELVEATRSQYAQELQQTQAPPLIQNAIASTYGLMKAAESAVFSITPLPLQGAKGLIQNVAAPMAIAALGTKIPGVDQAIHTTMSLASSFTSTAFVAVAGNALAYFGHAAMNAMPSSVAASLTAELPNFHWLGGIAGQSIASLSNAVSQAVVTGAADKAGQLTGAMGSAVLIGNTAIAIGRKVSYEVSTNGIKAIASEAQQSMTSLFMKSNQVLTRAEQFIESVKEKISGVSMSENSIAQQFNDPTLRTQLLRSDAVGVGETSDSLYARRRDSSIKDVQMQQTTNPSYMVIQGEYLVPAEGSKLNPMNADTFLALYESSGDLKPGMRMVEELKVVSPAKVKLGADGNYELVQKGAITTAELYQQQSFDTSTKDPVAPTVSPVRGKAPEVSKPVEVVNTPEVKTTTPIEAIAPNPEAPKPIVIESEEVESVKSTQDKAAEAYALSTLNTVFAARGIEIKNAQIDFNGETVFKLKNNSLDKSEMNNEAQDAIQKALSDPANLKGEVRITVGGQMLLHVKNGEVLAGHAFVKESVKVEVATPEKVRYDELASNVRATGYEKTKQIAAAAYRAGDSTKDIRAMLSQHDESYKKYAESNQAINDAMLNQANARSLPIPEGKSQEKTKERTPDMAIVA